MQGTPAVQAGPCILWRILFHWHLSFPPVPSFSSCSCPWQDGESSHLGEPDASGVSGCSAAPLLSSKESLWSFLVSGRSCEEGSLRSGPRQVSSGQLSRHKDGMRHD